MSITESSLVLDSMKLGISLDANTRSLLLERVWGFSEADARASLDLYQEYFARYNELCSRRLTFLDDWTHKELFEVAREMPLQSKKACAQLLRTSCSGATNLSPDHIEAGLRFIVRLVYCVDLDLWQPDDTLTAHLVSHFIGSTSEDKGRLSRMFNACSITELTDINITWTRDLNRHLLVMADNDNVALFEGASYLKLLRESVTGRSLFLANFIWETENSIALLCPTDGVYEKWLAKEQRTANLDIAFVRWCSAHNLGVAGRQIQSFDYWRDELIVLKEIYDDKQPRQLKDLWRDDRNPVQWWTLWIALTAFALSLMATVSGIILGTMQVYKAYHPSPVSNYGG